MSLLSVRPRINETGFIGTFPALPRRGSIRSYVSINVAAITQDIRDVLAEWENLDLDDLLPTVPAGRPESYPDNEVAAVEFIERVLDTSADRIFAATDVKPRTFYGWREGDRKPRASSVGTLWSAVEAVYYLDQCHPNLGAWFKDNAEAQELFDTGNFSEFARLEVDWLVRTYGVIPTEAPYSHLDDIAAGPSRRPGESRRTQVEPAPVPITRIKAQAQRADD